MRTLILIGLLLIAGASMPLPAATTTADKAPDTKQAKAAHKGIPALKGMSKLMREACLAERLALLFTEDGSPAYSGALSAPTEKNVQYFNVYDAAQFIGTDGKPHKYYEVSTKGGRKKTPANLVKARRALLAMSDDEVLSAGADDAGELCRQAAAHWLGQMPELLRDAVLADVAEQLFLPKDKGNPYKDEIKVNINGSLHPLIIRALANKTRFIDSKGEVHDFAATLRQHETNLSVRRSRMLVYWCAKLIGKDAVLSLYADEAEAIKKHTEEYEPSPFED